MKKFSIIVLFLVMGLGCGTNVTTDIDSEDIVMEEVILDNLIPEDIMNDDEGVISDSMDVQNDIEDVNDTKDTNTTDEECGTPCACDVGSTCTDSVCVPDCEGKKCGPDGCDGTCGTCDDGNPCTDDSCNEGSCESYYVLTENTKNPKTIECRVGFEILTAVGNCSIDYRDVRLEEEENENYYMYLHAPDCGMGLTCMKYVLEEGCKLGDSLPSVTCPPK